MDSRLLGVERELVVFWRGPVLLVREEPLVPVAAPMPLLEGPVEGVTLLPRPTVGAAFSEAPAPLAYAAILFACAAAANCPARVGRRLPYWDGISTLVGGRQTSGSSNVSDRESLLD